MPIDYSKYPKNWKTEIRPRIMERAGRVLDENGEITENACCEWCGVKNYEHGARDLKGEWHKEIEIENMKSDVGFTHFGCEFPKIIKIVLTIAHLDHDETNHDVKDDRLAALCQKCHLNYDQEEKKRRKAVKKYQGSLFPM